MAVSIKTERLELREFTPEDAAFIVTLVNTPGWIEFIGDRNIHTLEEARSYLQSGPIQSYATHGFGLYHVILNVSAVSLGMCGLLKRDYLESPDIGFAFLPEFTGRGYACEAAMATLRFASDTLKIERVMAITLPANTRSIRLLEKVGMGFERTFRPPTDGEELMLFSTSPIKT